MKKKNLLLFFILMGFVFSQSISSEKLGAYVDALSEKGMNPVTFILEKLDKHDLILFDDGLHNAVEPFEFYQSLINNEKFQNQVKYIFLEIIAINQQAALDNYFNSDSDDIKLLFPAFQNDFSGTGWPYKTYFDLLQVIWKINSRLPVQDRLIVLAVNAPTYWPEIKTSNDLNLFRLSLRGNDYTMYKIILSYLNDFKSGKKGIFLTNTRHAYKKIKNRNNQYYWNCGTFFYFFNPGKTYSIRFHNINLSFQSIKKVDLQKPKTTEGLEGVKVDWVRLEDGLWDSAFETFGNAPVAFDIKDTPFGRAKYIGNHMLNAAPDLTMYDAYDALIFLAPVEKIRSTAIVDYIYTEGYKQELERRMKILYTKKQLEKILNENSSTSIREYIDKFFIFRAEKSHPLGKLVGPRNAWKTKNE